MKFERGQPKPPGSGRKPGQPNHLTGDLRDMIREALRRAGDVDYLVKQARENPAAFMSLLAKLLPKDVHVEGSPGLGAIVHQLLDERARREAGGKLIDVPSDPRSGNGRRGMP